MYTGQSKKRLNDCHIQRKALFSSQGRSTFCTPSKSFSIKLLDIEFVIEN